MDQDIEVSGFTIPNSELEERFSTTGGPGGQHANRNETGVTLRFPVRASSLPAEVKERIVTELSETVEVTAFDSRSQSRNRAAARQRMVSKLEDALREAPERKTTKKPRSADKRRLHSKRARGDVKKGRRPPGVDDY